jgi:hypothetical protein
LIKRAGARLLSACTEALGLFLKWRNQFSFAPQWYLRPGNLSLCIGRETSAGTFNRSYLEDALLHNKGEPDRSGPGMLFSSKIKADLGGAASAPPRKGRRVSTTYPTDAQRSQKNKKNKK